MSNLMEHSDRSYREEMARQAAEKPTVEYIRQRPAHPVHIPEHLRGIVTEREAE